MPYRSRGVDTPGGGRGGRLRRRRSKADLVHQLGDGPASTSMPRYGGGRARRVQRHRDWARTTQLGRPRSRTLSPSSPLAAAPRCRSLSSPTPTCSAIWGAPAAPRTQHRLTSVCAAVGKPIPRCEPLRNPLPGSRRRLEPTRLKSLRQSFHRVYLR